MVGNWKDKGQMNQVLMPGQEASASCLINLVNSLTQAQSANFWSSSQVGSSAWLRSLGAENDQVFRQVTFTPNN